MSPNRTKKKKKGQQPYPWRLPRLRQNSTSRTNIGFWRARFCFMGTLLMSQILFMQDVCSRHFQHSRLNKSASLSDKRFITVWSMPDIRLCFCSDFTNSLPLLTSESNGRFSPHVWFDEELLDGDVHSLREISHESNWLERYPILSITKNGKNQADINLPRRLQSTCTQFHPLEIEAWSTFGQFSAGELLGIERESLRQLLEAILQQPLFGVFLPLLLYLSLCLRNPRRTRRTRQEKRSLSQHPDPCNRRSNIRHLRSFFLWYVSGSLDGRNLALIAIARLGDSFCFSSSHFGQFLSPSSWVVSRRSEHDRRFSSCGVLVASNTWGENVLDST